MLRYGFGILITSKWSKTAKKKIFRAVVTGLAGQTNNSC